MQPWEKRLRRAAGDERCPQKIRDDFTKYIVEFDRLRGALKKISELRGCECDEYEGHECLMCKVRGLAREGKSYD